MNSDDLIYQLDDRPPLVETIFAALQHVLAMFVSIITPPLIICSALGADIKTTSYIVSSSLLMSGVATFIQVKRVGIIGSGLLSIQGTSFSFVGTIIAVGLAVINRGDSIEHALALIFGVTAIGSFIEIAFSRLLSHVRYLFPPLVTGIVVTLIGMTLIKVGIISMGGGYAAQQSGDFASIQNLSVSGLTFIVILGLYLSPNKRIRMSAVFGGLLAGFLLSLYWGMVDFSQLNQLQVITVPIPFKYGVTFSLEAFIPVAFIFLITMIEAIGDLTATSAVSGLPVTGDKYIQRIRGGILGDGFNSLLAAIFNTFPNTTFSQNNGVIQLTGVASRHVGYFISAILLLLGLFPIIGGFFKLIPEAVLGGATIIMFGTIAVSGIKIIADEKIDRRASIILATSFALGLGVSFEPKILSIFPETIKAIFSSGLTLGGVTAILLNLILPKQTS